ncbi:DUF3352 domain-containing protein [Pseudanabaena sp. FACHB-2040]|uniref:DUF3352 domain-containing protein n=1 Tax=Pseudanabaena sp. FACHB-2040 TaxID=2692859 RepID=UPI001682BF6C|nr:DUF3352 domain-containing protein [Pseudanabaena sp. FACHB-2040]MBD2257289.1 DUF3352 domain-containing protein [Pseudanabaena sp. FACHB-2040]
MKVRTFFSTLTLVVVALLVVGIGGFIGLTSRSPLFLLAQGGQSLPTAAPFVSKNAPVMVSLLTRPDRLTDLWLLLAAPGDRRQTQAEIARLEKSLLAGVGLTYEEDIRPWLGNEITFAVTTADLDQDPDNGSQPGYLLALSCRDSERAKAVLELFWQKRAIAGDRLRFEQFAGSKLIYTPAQGDPSPADLPQAGIAEFGPQSVASALVGQKFVLLANDPRVLQQALTAAQSRDLNLEHDLGYRKAVASLDNSRIGLAVVNLPPSLSWLGLATHTTAALRTQGLGSSDGIIDRAVFSLRPHRQGLLADTVLLAAAGHPFKPQQATPVPPEAAQFLPADTALAAVGSQLDQLWQDVRNNLPYYAAAVPAWQPLWDRLQAPLPNQPPEALLDWISGDYALGLVTRSPQMASGWVLAAHHQDNTPAAMARFDELARQQGLSVGPLTLADQSVSAWTRLSIASTPDPNSSSPAGASPELVVTTTVAGLHTQSGEYELLSNSPTSLYRAFQVNGNSLLTSPQWQKTIEPLTLPNAGYLYLDWQTLRPDWLNRAPWLKLIETLGQPLFSHLQSIAVTSYGRDEQAYSGGIFFRLSRS